MSKSLRKVETEKQIFSILEAQLKRQDEQGKTIHTMFEGVKNMYTEMNQKFEEMTEMVQEVRDSVDLTNSECAKLLSEVAAKSVILTKDRYNEEDGSFKKVVGIHRRMIWKQLKTKYDVPKYNCIRRIDFDEAVTFVRDFRPEDYI